MSEKIQVLYIAGTHWDREWYEPQQEFRRWLVETIDEVIDAQKKDARIASFHLDGQSIVLEDYLEIRPDREPELRQLLNEGRILAGPWYVQPDLWLVSGESLIRNLQIGTAIARVRGAHPSRMLYAPDLFGYHAFYPALANGFGLDTTVVWRGLNDSDAVSAFRWKAPNGDSIVAFRCADSLGYGQFTREYRLRWVQSGKPREAAQIRRLFDPLIAIIRQDAIHGIYPIFDADDHKSLEPDAPLLLDLLNQTYPDLDFVWSNHEHLAEALATRRQHLPVITGELRNPAQSMQGRPVYLIAHTLSARYPLKRENAICQSRLELWAEPLAAWAHVDATGVAPRFLDLAWRWLIQNHPHDSICGCSIDQVHDDMRYRFDQSRLLAEGVVRTAIGQLAGPSHHPANEWDLLVWNPCPFPRDNAVVTVSFPLDPKKFSLFKDGLRSAPAMPLFEVCDESGTVLSHQILDYKRSISHKRFGQGGRNWPDHRSDICEVAIRLDLPSLGHAPVKIRPTITPRRDEVASPCLPSIANDALLVEVAANGNVKVTDRLSGNAFENLLSYEDSGDYGDGWTRGALINDRVVLSSGSPVTISHEAAGPLRQILRVDRVIEVPACFNLENGHRSERTLPLKITDRLILDAGANFVRVQTVIQNSVRDHRLRVLFPTEITSPETISDTAFAINRRQAKPPANSPAWRERWNPELPCSSFFAVQDQRRGMCIVPIHGPCEFAMEPTRPGCLALTLFRATATTVSSAGEEGGQLLGPLDFDYLVAPFAPPFNPSSTLRLSQIVRSGTRSHAAINPVRKSFAQLSGDHLVLSALKPAPNPGEIVARIWNPSESKASGALQFPSHSIKFVTVCRLDESPQPDGTPAPSFRNSSIKLDLQAHHIITLRIGLQNVGSNPPPG